MTARRGPKARFSIEDHQAVLDQVEACRAKHPSWTITATLACLGITENRYQYAKERVAMARRAAEREGQPEAQEQAPEPSDPALAAPVQPGAYQPTRCSQCKTARARSMWASFAVCQGCYEKLKADWQGRAEVAKAAQADAEESDMEARASRVVPMLSNPEPEEAEDEQSEESDEEEDGVLDGMEIEFESDGDEPEETASGNVGQELVRVFVIEGTVEAVAAILERRFG